MWGGIDKNLRHDPDANTDPRLTIVGLSCIAVSKSNDDGSEEGYRFSATVNWTDASYSWHLGS